MAQEQLSRIECTLEDLLERQRISRIDTIVFLLYPAVFFTVPLLANWYMQWEILTRISFGPITATGLILFLTIFFVTGIVVTFVRFILAYARDDLKRRFTTCQYFLRLVVLLFGGVFMNVLPSRILYDLVPNATAFGWWGLAVRELLDTVKTAAITFFFLGLGNRFAASVVSWIQHIAPRRIEAEHIIFPDFSERMSYWFSMSKIALCVSCILYGIIVIYMALTTGPLGTAFYHMAALVILVLLTFIAVLEKRVRSKIS